jgi:eukaryotic-like serine/threonine-protein kinase
MSSSTSEIPAPLDPDLDVDQVIGEYRIESKIGQGGFGTVYRAVHPLIGKVVAIKVLARKFSVDPEMVSRFIAEARSVNQIRHRHIIDIFLFGTLADGRAYYVMEYLDGEPLDATIDRLGHMSLAQALPILRAMARALDAAHGKGIAHRDLKPENIFLVRDPDNDDADGVAGSVANAWPKLLDFGIAKLMAADDPNKHKTRTGIPIGTPYYMSPEQCRGKDVDHRTDFYAFGVVAYQMLTGVHPIDADDYMSIMMRQLTDEPTPASTLVPELPPGVDDAIAWLMKKNRDERPPNLVTAVRSLEQAAEASGIAIPRQTSGWDAATPQGSTPFPPRNVTPAPPKSPSSASLPGGAVAALATTMPSGVDITPAPVPRSRAPLVAALAVAAAVVAIVLTRGSSERPLPPPSLASNSAPPPTPIDAAPKQAAVVPQTPTTTIITVTGVPDGTDVSIAGSSIGVAPGPVQLPHGADPVVLTFKADGFVSASKTVTPDRDQPLEIALKKKPRAQTIKPNNKDDIIDVFGGKKP